MTTINERFNIMKYEVTFTRYHSYDIEADNEDEAIELAEEEFESDMRSPIADCYYDEVDCLIVEDEYVD